MLEKARAYHRAIPDELKTLDQWCIAGSDKAPLYINNGVPMRASVTDSMTWMSYEEALRLMVASKSPGIGFVLTDEAGFTCIDMDVVTEAKQLAAGKKIDSSKWTTPEDYERYNLILKTFNSYAETSISGTGAHVFLRGRVGMGARRDNIEVYSQERFIICTGQCFNGQPIREGGEYLSLLVQDIRRSQVHERLEALMVELEPTEDDDTIMSRAMSAHNGENFSMLFRGEWQGKYKSQSEADLALLSMFTFYSKSNEQCRRLFRASELGKRDKSVKDNRYIDFTLETIRNRQAKSELIDASGAEMARRLVATLNAGASSETVAAASMAIQEEIPLPEAPVGEDELQWPPGLAGKLAQYVYKSSPRPVREIAIATALGFLAGVTGKAYNISNSGLNMYMILVARSGVGKEALHSGISLICAELNSAGPGFDSFVDFTEYVSAAALKKGLQARASVVNVSGEFGRRLARLATDHTEGQMAALRTEMTHLYQKSGQGNIVGGLGYSNKDNNVGNLSGVAYSLIGESTPETFYQSITRSMMEDGFLSRFTIIQYEGQRPPLHTERDPKMPKLLLTALTGLCAQAIANNSKSHVTHIGYDDDAWAKLNEFDKQCDERINGTTDEGVRQMWNRAHLKVLRMAGILAASDNPVEPCVTMQHVEWALDLIHRDIKVMNSKLAQGDLGDGDDYTRVQKLIHILKDYFRANKIPKSYQIPEGMREAGLCPYRYMQMRAGQAYQFRGAKQGATRAFQDSVRTMIDNGYLQEMHKDKIMEDYNYTGKTFRVVSLPAD